LDWFCAVVFQVVFIMAGKLFFAVDGGAEGLGLGEFFTVQGGVFVVV
jgi:hypothetical protein